MLQTIENYLPGVRINISPFMHRQDGRFKHSSMSIIWKQYEEKHHQWLLKLTEQFDLSYALPDQDVNLVPCLLPGAEPQVNFILIIENISSQYPI